MARSRLLVYAALGVALLPCEHAWAQAAGEWRNSEQLWRSTCAYCHDGHVASQLLGERLTAQAVLGAARGAAQPMPSFTPSQVSDAELRALTDWIAHQKKPPADDQRAPRHATRQRAR
ncbi:MAG TPA: cytochrome c [Steroidobacteraceae bacterium]|nr:cytochrome c [Steroidobacteraceae bacterium]